MAYYLGKDVGVIVHTEEQSNGITVTAANAITVANPGANIPAASCSVDFDSGHGIVTNLTGLDLGIGTNDEDVSFMGVNTPLKAEIRKETTVTLTKKKNSTLFDVLFSGDTSDNVARWGLTGSSVRDGLTEPDTTFGYRLFIQLKGAAEIFSIRNAQMNAHTISLNADGTQEETVEFVSQVNPVIFAATTSAGLTSGTAAGDL